LDRTSSVKLIEVRAALWVEKMVQLMVEPMDDLMVEMLELKLVEKKAERMEAMLVEMMVVLKEHCLVGNWVQCWAIWLATRQVPQTVGHSASNSVDLRVDLLEMKSTEHLVPLLVEM
jgi:hypothetical protein